MIKPIDNLPDNVLSFAAEGKVTEKGYETILVPVVESKFRIHKKSAYYTNLEVALQDLN
jgi:hypothetical protein